MSVGRSGGARGPHALDEFGKVARVGRVGESGGAVLGRDDRRPQHTQKRDEQRNGSAPRCAVQRMATPSSARAATAIVKNEIRSAGACATTVEPASNGAMPPKRVS